jgi:regulator of RNase E activity RraA
MRASFFSDVFGGTVRVTFYEDGKLRTCKVSQDVSIQGRTFRRGDRIILDANGILR